jgi:hypothetical protein
VSGGADDDLDPMDGLRVEPYKREADPPAPPPAKKSDAIWHTPILILAGLTAIIGVAIGVMSYFGSMPPDISAPLQYGFAAASVTFTLGRIISNHKVTRRELELLVLASAIFIAPYIAKAAGGIALFALIAFLLDLT